jgi:hypothetical protein
MDAIEQLIRTSAIPEAEMMQALHVFSLLPTQTRDQLFFFFRQHPELLMLFWDNYKVKCEAYTKKDTALWTSILDAEREQIEAATE